MITFNSIKSGNIESAICVISMIQTDVLNKDSDTYQCKQKQKLGLSRLVNEKEMRLWSYVRKHIDSHALVGRHITETGK